MEIPENLKPAWSSWMTLRMFHAAKHVIESVQEPSDPGAREKFHKLARIVNEYEAGLLKYLDHLGKRMKSAQEPES